MADKATIIGEVEKPVRLWDNYKVIGEVKKSDSIKFVVGAGIRNGVKYINIREFYKRKRDEVWMPGRDGITIPLVLPIEKGTKTITPYSEMITKLVDAAEALGTMELYDEENAVYGPKKVKKVKQ